MNNNSRGVSHIFIIFFVFLTLGIIGFLATNNLKPREPVPVITSSPNPTTGWEKYTTGDRKFSFKYPDNIIKICDSTPKYPDEWVTFIKSSEKCNASAYMFKTVEVYVFDPAKFIIEYIDIGIQTSKTSYLLDGREAAKTTYKPRNSERESAHTVVVRIELEEPNVLEFHFYLENINEDTMDQILSTFKFTG